MAKLWVEVVGDALPEPVEVCVYEKGIAAGLDARKRFRKQVRQRGPVEPAFTHRHRLERQPKSETRLQYRVARIDCGSIETIQ